MRAPFPQALALALALSACAHGVGPAPPGAAGGDSTATVAAPPPALDPEPPLASASLPVDPADQGQLDDLEKRCDSGEARSCAPLAERLRLGRGGPPDAARAAQRAEQGCQAGSARACFDLALAARDGVGVVAANASS
jgi:TPR repeat protein